MCWVTRQVQWPHASKTLWGIFGRKPSVPLRVIGVSHHCLPAALRVATSWLSINYLVATLRWLKPTELTDRLWHFPYGPWPFKPGCELGVQGSRMPMGRMWLRESDLAICLVEENLEHSDQIRIECSVCTCMWNNNRESREGLQGYGTVNNAHCPTPSPPCAHHLQLLCVLLGRKRTCKGGVTMFPMDREELTLSCYLLEWVYYSYVLLMTKKIPFYTCASEAVEVLSSFGE